MHVSAFFINNPAVSAHSDAIQTHISICPGSDEPAAERSVMTVAGRSCTEAVLRTAKVTISLLGLPFLSVFCTAMARMAFNPGGVAALPSPKMFAEIFMQMYFSASLPFFTPGMISRSIGRIIVVRISVIPDFRRSP